MFLHLPTRMCSSEAGSDNGGTSISTPSTGDPAVHGSSSEGSGNEDTSPTSGTEEKSRQQLEEERVRAVQAALANNNKVKAVTAQANSYYERMVSLAKSNPEVVLPSLYSEDPDLAEKISKEEFGSSYEEVMNSYNESSKDDIQKLVEAEVNKRMREQEQSHAEKTIEKVQEGLFVDLAREHAPGSYKFTKVMEEYRSYGAPTSEKQARAFFRSALDVVNGDDDTSGMGDQLSKRIPSMNVSQGRGDAGPMPSKSFLDAAMSRGVTKEEAIKRYRQTVEGMTS